MGGCGSCGTSWKNSDHYRGQGCPKKPHDMCSVCGEVFPINYHKEHPTCNNYSIFFKDNYPTFDDSMKKSSGVDIWDYHSQICDDFRLLVVAEGKKQCGGLIVPNDEYQKIKKYRKELCN